MQWNKTIKQVKFSYFTKVITNGEQLFKENTEDFQIKTIQFFKIAH